MWIVLGVLGTSAIFIGGWAVAVAFVSPEQREAAAAPPGDETIFAVVEEGDLVDARDLHGTVVAEVEMRAALSVAADAVRSVVTAAPLGPGDVVTVGDIGLQVNGQPVFVFGSPFPFYRDLGRGDHGPDVRALQEGLVHLGFLRIADGDFGPATEAAVVRLYKSAGAVAPVRSVTVNVESEVTPGAGEETPGPPSEAEHFMPIWSLLAVSSLPARVVSLPAVGDVVDGETAAHFAASELIIRTPLPIELNQLIVEGAAVQYSLDGGTFVDAIVSNVGEEEKQPGQDGATSNADEDPVAYFDVAPAELLAPTSENRAVTVRLVTSVIAESSLLVPTRAVANRGASSGVVLKREADGILTEVPVTVSGNLRGRTAITPENAGTLDVGDEVKVG